MPLKVAAASFYAVPATGSTPRGSVIEGGSAIVVAKRLDGREAELFAVPFDPPAPLLRPAAPGDRRLAGFRGARHRGRPCRRTASSWPSAPMRWCGSTRGKDRPWDLVAEVPLRAPTVEGIAWDGHDLILAGEGRGVDRVRRATGAAREDRMPER